MNPLKRKNKGEDFNETVPKRKLISQIIDLSENNSSSITITNYFALVICRKIWKKVGKDKTQL